jgi:predicted 2-oxoglutarate/Fe(II)-dependent dioxygenase YbiX
LVHLPYEKRQRPSSKYAKREKGQEAPIDQKIIPKVVQVKDGQTMIYKRDLLHGVGQVEKGTRLVLVSWYKTNETD